MKPYSKTIWRTIGHNKGRFLANFFICLLSVFVSSGLAACPDSFQESFSNGYVGNPPDIIVKGTNEDGLSQDQIDSISSFGEVFAFSSFDFTPDEGESYYRVYLVDLETMDMAKPVISEGEAPSSLSEAIAISQIGEFAVGESLSFDLLYPISSEVPDSMKGMLGLPSEYKVVSLSEDDLYRSHAPETAMVELEGDETAYLDGVFYLDSSFLDNPLLSSMLPITDCYLRLDLHNREYFSSDYSNALARAKEELEGEFGDDAVILTMEDNTSYAIFDYYNDKVEKISFIIPLFFVLICALINLITMQRLMKDERSEIGCYSSLGFHKSSIAFKFLFFAFLSAFFGCLGGYLLGTPLVALLIFPAYEQVFAMGELAITFSSVTGILIAAGIVLVSLAVTGFICLSYLKEAPSELLKDKSPKPGKKILLERISFLWKRISFSWKSSLRNIFRQKKNLVLTGASVIGGTVIVFLGFALNDASAALVDDPLFGSVADSMGQISAVIILLAIALAVTVIYSLANMNIEDRKREIATLKVLGYHNVECSLYTFREIIFIVCLSSIIGVGVGALVTYWAFDYLSFGTLGDVQWYSYLASPLLIIVSTILVNLVLSPHIAGIDMNSSLKSVD